MSHDEPQEGFCNVRTRDSDDGETRYCARRVADPDDVCWMHGDRGGAPEGNTNALDNDGGAPLDNINAMSTGVRMSLERKVEAIQEHGTDQQLQQYLGYFEEYAASALNESQAEALAALRVFEDDVATDLIANDHDTTVYTEDGTPVEVFDDSRTDAMLSYAREIRLGLHYEGLSTVGSDSGQGSRGHDNLDVLVTGGGSETETETDSNGDE